MNKTEALGSLIVHLLVFAIIIAIVFFAKWLVSEDFEKAPGHMTTSQSLHVECVDGYKFVTYSGGFGGGVSQMLVLDDKRNLVPAMCPSANNN